MEKESGSPSGRASPTSLTSLRLTLSHFLCIHPFICLFIHVLFLTLQLCLFAPLCLFFLYIHREAEKHTHNPLHHVHAGPLFCTKSLLNITCADRSVDTKSRQRIVRLESKRHLRNISTRSSETTGAGSSPGALCVRSNLSAHLNSELLLCNVTAF